MAKVTTRTETRPARSPSPTAGPPPVVEGWTAIGLAFLSGLFYFLAFPGTDLWPFSFVALIPLIVALRGARPGRAAFLGWVAGFTMTMLGFWWLLEMLEVFSGFPGFVCFFFLAILSAYQAGRMTLCGWLAARAERRGWPPGLVFALAFGASEIAFPLLFPWTYAATVHQVPVLLQLAELGGPILVAMVLVGANLVLADPVLAWLEARRRARLGLAQKPLALAAERIQLRRRMARWGALVATALVYGAVRIPQVDAAVRAAPKARVGIVQANMSLLAKRQQVEEGLRRHVRLTKKLAAEGPLDLVVWSETAVMKALPEDQAATLMKETVTAQLGVPAVVGAVLYRRVDGPRKYVMYNSALVSDEQGTICPSCRYDKVFLLAFGEYLPLGETFPILYDWSPNSGRFTPGTRYRPVPVGDREVALIICYEDILPGFVNGIVRGGRPDLLVNMTNDAWFGDTAEPWVHFALAKLRAVEHRRFLVRSTNSGVSGFVDPVGRTVKHGGTFQEEAFTAEVAWLRSATPFELVGEAPWWLTALLVFGAGFVWAPGAAARVESGDVPPPPAGGKRASAQRRTKRAARSEAAEAGSTPESPAGTDAPPEGPHAAPDGPDQASERDATEGAGERSTGGSGAA